MERKEEHFDFARDFMKDIHQDCLKRRIVNHKTKIVCHGRRTESHQRRTDVHGEKKEESSGEFNQLIFSLDLFGLYLAARSGLRPQKIRLRTTHPRAKLLTLHRLTSLASFFARRFLEVGSEGVPLHPHVFQRLVNDGGRCGESTVLRLHSISLPKRFIVRNRPRFANEFPLLSSLSKRISLIFSSHWANVGKNSENFF